MPPSRQERRKAKRDATKRAPRAAAAGAAGATGAAGVAADLASLSMNAGGDWTTQAEDHSALFRAIGAEIVERRAAQGDRLGLTLVHFPAQLEPCLT
jgi:hypothetical protein